eukprot:353810-Chlamydomonas_euryale.AAC.6
MHACCIPWPLCAPRPACRSVSPPPTHIVEAQVDLHDRALGAVARAERCTRVVARRLLRALGLQAAADTVPACARESMWHVASTARQGIFRWP